MSQSSRLDADALYYRCDTGSFSFETTDELEELEEVVGQQRATEALHFGTGIRQGGYNLYALGLPGTGRRALIGRHLRERAAEDPRPPDVVYLNNFEDSRKPSVMMLPAGDGPRLRDDMKQFVEDLEAALPAAFESEEYRARRKELEESLQEEQEEPLEELKDKAKGEGLALVKTAQGMGFAPLKSNGEVMPPEEFNQLSEAEREKVQEKIGKLQGDLEKFLYRVPRWQRQSQRKIRELDREFTRVTVDGVMEEMRRDWEDHDEVIEYFDAVRDDVVDNVKDFLDDDAGQQQALPGIVQQGQEEKSLRRYRVNLLVDNGRAEGAPVITEDHPRYQNLFGTIEHTSRMGALFTDFTLIKGGSLHRANGGYLVVEALKLLTQPLAWDGLKRALFSGQLRVEPPSRELLPMVSTVSLEPQAMTLDVKVVLIGSRKVYQLLNRLDPEFGQLFKVAADFEESMPRNEDNQQLYARMIAGLARQEELLPLDREATARVIEQGAREAEDAERLSIHKEGITDLLRESDFWARERKQEVIRREDVQKSVDARHYRAGRVPERLREEIQRGTLLIDSRGSKVGQINSLAVGSAGQTRFGHACRVTARVRLGKGEVKDIQREAKLAGRIYSKAVMTLTGYLGAHYAPDFPLMLGASLVFEQTYGDVEGDSATAAELFALLSALAETPLKQSLAVTGSANQYGDVQPVGGVNEKIEGFFATCRDNELTGDQGVLIPEANVKHLMLNDEVVQAVREEKFAIYPFRTIDEGLAIITGETAGERDDRNRFPEGSVNHRVQHRLMEMAEQARQWNKGEESNGRDSQ